MGGWWLTSAEREREKGGEALWWDPSFVKKGENSILVVVQVSWWYEVSLIVDCRTPTKRRERRTGLVVWPRERQREREKSV